MKDSEDYTIPPFRMTNKKDLLYKNNINFK